jgi:hypothetical protein
MSVAVLDTRALIDVSMSNSKKPTPPAAVKAFFVSVLRGDATKEQAKDTGMALVLVFLFLWLYRRSDVYIGAAFAIHLVNMVVPQVFRPVAVVWFGLSHVIGTVASRVILAVIFFGVVTPIAVWRRAFGADSLKLKAFKAGSGSVMKERNHTFVGSDLEQPY